uniref:peptidyl-tRNA hydrolase n=1 Tax=Pyramimonas obovata TaxID=1411642 RepID=A0A7S0RL38_9CHLO|mmetsp:Transcript_36287/g.79163  ORF Transcript_36287/g.79163 Transcript_36287/m.79163 type:complete len:272 (+) Transcript_36287:223-1038(+)|eukprot:CAMPEP_0118933346 /NCGR_PEP_ID=MMETSP1169-20130426/11938_1 /TAXON_ID=36882 /ORGANISM="Pyramimonas obovata, Strain CCMP722" /LENGTH=271 /DNA_ID=CAMNT_0006876097 /DNA_START=140 /DNA_END=955 /DNA_ORIENTATION=-
MNNAVVAPFPELVAQMMDMGFTENQSRRALMVTSNTGIEAAVNWLMENLNDPAHDQPPPAITGPHPMIVPDSPTAINWRPPGASLAQQPGPHGQTEGTRTGHVSPSGQAVGVPSPNARVVVNPAGERVPALISSADAKVAIVIPLDLPMTAGKLASQCAHAAVAHYKLSIRSGMDWVPNWEASGEKTVVLACDNSQMIPELIEKAQSFMLLTHVVRDAGLTEVAPGTVTCMAVGGPCNHVDMVTRDLEALHDLPIVQGPSIRAVNDFFDWK